ncbi:MAG: hypothetical protein ACRDI2_21500, partial [Chloroflexota bacterium]
ANLVVSTRNTGEIGDLDQLVRTLGGERFVPTYVEPWSTNLAYETIRPEPKDLEGLPPEVPADGLDVNWGYRQFWADPAACSEGALTRTAAETGAPTGEPTEDVTDGSRERRLSLFVDAGLDLYVGYVYAGGVINLAGARVANLRDDPPEEVREKLLSVEWPPEPPPDADLARRYGDPNGRRVFMSQAGLRRKWLEAWRAEHGLPWITSL